MRLKILACFLFLLIAQGAMGQMTIKGRVIGKDDELPLPMVTILIDSTENGVATNFEGEFQITIPANSYLVFRYLGYVTQKVKPKANEFLLIKLKPDCIIDHFDSRLLNLGSGIDLINDQFGLSMDYTSRYQLPIDFKASASYYWNSQSNNLNTNLSILDIIHSCELELRANFRYQSVNMDNYEFQNSTISIEPNFNRWTTRLGFGLNQIQKEMSPSNNLGLLVGIEKELFIGRTYVPVSLSTIFWQNKPEINISAEHVFLRTFRFKLAYQSYEDFNSIIGSLGIQISTWKKAF